MGTERQPHLAVTPASALAQVFRLGAKDACTGSTLAAVATVVTHAMLVGSVAWGGQLRTTLSPQPSAQELALEVVAAEPPPPESSTAPPPSAPAAKSAARPPHAAVSAPRDPAPAPARAAAAVTSETDDEDLDPIVTGSADSYAGGWTASLGESMGAAYGVSPRLGGVHGGTGSGDGALRTPDQSRPAGLSDDTFWDCGFPWEADLEHINYAVAKLSVVVSPDGSAESVELKWDPGHGFGRVAKSCAMKQRFAAALDHNGHPYTAATKPFRIKFERR